MAYYLRHERFLKLISRETLEGRMVDVSSVCICRCGKRFDTDEQLEAHTARPITLLLSGSDLPPANLATSPKPVSVSMVQVEL